MSTTVARRHPATNTAPATWRVKRFKYLVREKDSRISKVGNQPMLLSLTLRGVIRRNLADGGKNPENYETYKNVAPGDLVFCQFDYDVTPRTIGIANEDGMVTGAYTILRPLNGVDVRYLYYFFLSLDYKKDLLYLCTGLRHTLSDDALFGLDIPLPDLPTQENIVDLLDKKVAKIDEAIAKKKQLLQLLEEKRIATIDDTIQDIAGIKTKIKHVVAVNPVAKTKFRYSETVSFVPMEAVSEYGAVTCQERKIKDVISGYTYFEEKDVVIAKITPCFENGKAAVVTGLSNGYGFGTTEFIVLRTSTQMLPHYLYYLIFSRHFRVNGINEMRGTAGQKRITESYVGNYEFNLPSIQKQTEVIKIINQFTAAIDSAKSKINGSIKLLEEYKTSLISSAVTGKVKI